MGLNIALYVDKFILKNWRFLIMQNFYNAKLYVIQKKKSDVIGFWKDENGKVYKDYIKIKSFSSYVKFQRGIAKLFQQGEKAIFYEKIGLGYIENANGKIEVLPYKIELKEKTLKSAYIKELILQHNGLTIFREKNIYKIVIYKG